METSICVATPCYRSDPQVALKWGASILVKSNFAGTSSAVTMCALIDFARERLVTQFLATECTHLFFRDDDIFIEPKVFQRLVAEAKPIVVAPYYKRISAAAVWAREALGCTLIHRSVIERMYDRYPELHYEVEGNKFVGLFDSIYIEEDSKKRKLREDGAFFYRAAQCGIEVHKLLDVIVDHAGVVSHYRNDTTP